MNCMDVGSNFTFGGIEMDAGPCAELMRRVEESGNILYGVGEEHVIVRMPLACKLKSARVNIVTLAGRFELVNKGFKGVVIGVPF